MKISVIIPTYKPQAYLWECLGSLCRQTFDKSEFEIILILNGCKDPYYIQIKEYISESMSACNVVLLQTDAGGVSNARNIGLDIAKGEYLTFIDDDDYVSSKYLECLYEKVAIDTVSLCYPYAFDECEPEVQLQYHLTDVYDEYHTRTKLHLSSKVRKYFSGPCMKLIPKHFIGQYRYDTRLSIGEDTLFMFIISKGIRNITFSSKKAIYYRRNRSNSAINVRRAKTEYLRTNIIQLYQYCYYYLKAPCGYNFIFFVTRVAGAFFSMFMNVFRP